MTARLGMAIRRLFAHAWRVLALATLAVTPCGAQDYPSKTVTIVVPLAAGTGIDTIARLYGEKLAASWADRSSSKTSPAAE